MYAAKMGRSGYLSCETCEETFYLGHGPYSGWVLATTINEYNQAIERTPELAILRRNQIAEDILKKHDGHTLVAWSDDWCCVGKGGHLYIEGGYSRNKILIRDYVKYRKVNAEKDFKYD